MLPGFSPDESRAAHRWVPIIVGEMVKGRFGESRAAILGRLERDGQVEAIAADSCSRPLQ